jgi:hypothetical protein
MPIGRPLGSRDKRPRQPRVTADAAPIVVGSESSRILQRRLAIKADGGGLSRGEERTLTPHALAEFEREQIARVKRLLGRSEKRINAARRQTQRENERASRHEAVTSFDVQVRGSCGSDVHLGGDS